MRTCFAGLTCYGVSLDWLYCRKEYINEQDTMLHILNALGNILKVAKRKTHNGDDTVLILDSRFRRFIFDVNSLNFAQSEYIKTNEKNYGVLRREVFLKHKNSLEEIFENVDFNDDNIEIHAVEINKEEVSIDFMFY
ncbi:hypothetical protein [Clostridium algidicarnis]|uniref:hypothetical protein n=1 Tax=Clostridium algidicarnis TaxID=37659 RepID=UPI001C0B3C16|nr:hypothetical protein [Clostridium algidicarnis]MBU3202756.1 hypothetical protein [Clostridium algidicarnis]MBU3210910.1 hypothetical protein [Clostridium algidicarnis]MBU3222582.1 hypothetical protein [Clostridium algidicarnis]